MPYTKSIDKSKKQVGASKRARSRSDTYTADVFLGGPATGIYFHVPEMVPENDGICRSVHDAYAVVHELREDMDKLERAVRDAAQDRRHAPSQQSTLDEILGN
jgi:hypothetical protein